jgi:hypothetical protein
MEVLIIITILVLEKRYTATRRGHHWGRGGHKPLENTQLSGPRTSECQFSPQWRQRAGCQSSVGGWENQQPRHNIMEDECLS